VGGLLFSQVVTLYITPVYYVYLDRLQAKVRSWRGVRKPEVRPAPQPLDEAALMGHHD
jgi:HAE1 family hydrophobic/amphiphilic exporter-1